MRHKIFQFEGKDGNWWFLTLLPLMLFFAIALYISWNKKNFSTIIPLLVQQLILYTVIFSSTDLGLRIRYGKNDYSFWKNLSLMLPGSILLLWIYSDESAAWILFAPSIIMVYFSVWLANHNPYNWIDKKLLKSASEDTSQNISSRLKRTKDFGGIKLK